MEETYIFNTHNVKTNNINTKEVLIHPGYGDEQYRVNILDLFEESVYPFKVQLDKNNLVDGTFATGWFDAAAIQDNKIKLDGVEYDASAATGENIGEKFVNIINNDEAAPVTASLEILEDGASVKYIVNLTSKVPGDEGNLITFEPVTEVTAENWASGNALTGGTDGYYVCSINDGNIYLPGKMICNISKKKNFQIPSDYAEGQIILQVIRDGKGDIFYKYKVVEDITEEGYNVVIPEEME